VNNDAKDLHREVCNRDKGGGVGNARVCGTPRGEPWQCVERENSRFGKPKSLLAIIDAPAELSTKSDREAGQTTTSKLGAVFHFCMKRPPRLGSCRKANAKGGEGPIKKDQQRRTGASVTTTTFWKEGKNSTTRASEGFRGDHGGNP